MQRQTCTYTTTVTDDRPSEAVRVAERVFSGEVRSRLEQKSPELARDYKAYIDSMPDADVKAKPQTAAQPSSKADASTCPSSLGFYISSGELMSFTHTALGLFVLAVCYFAVQSVIDKMSAPTHLKQRLLDDAPSIAYSTSERVMDALHKKPHDSEGNRVGLNSTQELFKYSYASGAAAAGQAAAAEIEYQRPLRQYSDIDQLLETSVLRRADFGLPSETELRQQHELRQAIDTVSADPATREILLHRTNDLSSSEISERTGIPDRTVRAKLETVKERFYYDGTESLREARDRYWRVINGELLDRGSWLVPRRGHCHRHLEHPIECFQLAA